MPLEPKQFYTSLLTWFKQYGRKKLPWQQKINPYRVWVSEIMLQQTQVATVIPYFNRFMQMLPDVHHLAKAPEDTVLHLWSGLGYYARARNLHKAAKMVVSDFAGKFPSTIEELSSLPGIGRSTAGAILSIAMHKPTPILDGNVKRVLTRFHAIEGWPGERLVEQKLWQLAEHYTPNQHNAKYTQAIMDLGATVCTRSQPKCPICPLQQHCVAHSQHRETEFPHKKTKKQLPTKHTMMLLIQNPTGEILLEKRPPIGIWGGLWCFPQCEPGQNLHYWCQRHYQIDVIQQKTWQPFRHTFSHFHLIITPVVLSAAKCKPLALEAKQIIWYNIAQPNKCGLAAPVKKLLQALKN